MSDCTVSWHNRSWEHIRKAPKSENGPTEKEHQKFLDDNDTGIVGRSTPAQTISAGATILFGLGFLFNINSDNNFLKGGSGFLAVVGAIVTGIFTFGKGWKLTEASDSSKPNPKPSGSPTGTKGAGETNKPDTKTPNPAAPSPEEEAFDPTNKESVMKKLDSLKLDTSLFLHGEISEVEEKLIDQAIVKCDIDQVTSWIAEDLNADNLKEYDSTSGSRYALLAIVDNERLDVVPKLCDLLDVDKNPDSFEAPPKLESDQYEMIARVLGFRYKFIDQDERIITKFEKIINDTQNKGDGGRCDAISFTAFHRYQMREAVMREGLKTGNESIRGNVIGTLKYKKEAPNFRAAIAESLMRETRAIQDGISELLFELLEREDVDPLIKKTIVDNLGQGYPEDRDVRLIFADIIKDIEDTQGPVSDNAGRRVSSDLIRCRALGENYDQNVDRLTLKELMDPNANPDRRAKIAHNLMLKRYIDRPDIHEMLNGLLKSKDTEPKVRKAIINQLGQGLPQSKDLLLEYADIIEEIEKTEGSITDNVGRPVTSSRIREVAAMHANKG